MKVIANGKSLADTPDQIFELMKQADGVVDVGFRAGSMLIELEVAGTAAELTDQGPRPSFLVVITPGATPVLNGDLIAIKRGVEIAAIGEAEG